MDEVRDIRCRPGRPSSHSQTHLFLCLNDGLAFPWASVSFSEQQQVGLLDGLWTALGVLVPTGNCQWDPVRPSPPVAPGLPPPRPHLHARRLLQRQTNRVAAVRAQHPAKRAHAAAAAATEELSHGVAVLRAAPAARIFGLRWAQPPRSPTWRRRARHSPPSFGDAAQRGAGREIETWAVGRGAQGRPTSGRERQTHGRAPPAGQGAAAASSPCGQHGALPPICPGSECSGLFSRLCV